MFAYSESGSKKVFAGIVLGPGMALGSRSNPVYKSMNRSLTVWGVEVLPGHDHGGRHLHLVRGGGRELSVTRDEWLVSQT
jgi:hypothetical protein